ncbi:MAG: hypothetical protein ABFC21_01460 [Rectinema sp.]
MKYHLIREPFLALIKRPSILPPLTEQSRIVARVQELMPVIDRLEERLAMRDKTAVLASELIVKINQV